jgi:hypothetical protein
MASEGISDNNRLYVGICQQLLCNAIGREGHIPYDSIRPRSVGKS